MYPPITPFFLIIHHPSLNLFMKVHRTIIQIHISLLFQILTCFLCFLHIAFIRNITRKICLLYRCQTPDDAAQMFDFAKRKKYITENPLEDVRISVRFRKIVKKTGKG